jgi:chromosome partitioning protein
MKVLSVINQKGGVGKTTTTLALGAGFLFRGFKVLCIDLDAQSNFSTTLNANLDTNCLDLLTKKTTTNDIIQHINGYDIISANKYLAVADSILTMVGKEYKLAEALEGIKANYDYIIIDTPPALGILTVNALAACDMVIVPAVYSLQGIEQLHDTVSTVKQYCNKNLTIQGVLLTRFSSRTILSKNILELLEQTAKKIQTKLFKTTIREAIAIKEAQANRQDIFSYAPTSNAAIDYNNFINELFEEQND